ncbi:S-layer homology domain-containing protein [[Eubacterium] yurii]|nr:S-layer homology domain-containing protein [[Eubacterium] yurii]
MGAKKIKSALSMFVAFAVSFSSILPATFADKDTLTDKRRQVIEIADKILAKDDLATRFRGTTYSNEGSYEKFAETPWYDTWESAQKWKFKAESLSEKACDNAISEMMYNDAVYGFPISHVLKKDGFYKGNYKIVKVKSIYGEKHYQEIYKKEKDSLGNDIELKEIKALFDENVRIIKEGNSYDIQMNVKTDRVRELNTAYLNKIATKDVKRQFIKDYKDKEKDGGFILVGIPGELNGENIVVFDMSYVDESGNKKTLPPFGIEIDYASLQRDDKWSDKKSEEELLNKAQRFQMETSAIMESDDAKYVDENKKKVIEKSLKEIEEFISSNDKSYDRFYEIANPIIDMEYGFKMMPSIVNIIGVQKSSIGTYYTNTTYTQKSLDEMSQYLDNLEKNLTFKSLKDLVLENYMVNNVSQIMLRYNTSKLEELIKQADDKKEADYTADSYLKMKNARDEAKKWVELCKKYRETFNETSTYEKKLEKALKELVAVKPQVEKVKLTLQGEDISSNPQAGDIEKGKEVVITLSPKPTKIVKTFTVNNVDKKSELKDNVYKFEIKEDTVVKVEYEDKSPQVEEKVYTVRVKFLNANGLGGYSMANQCLNESAKLVMGKDNKLMLKLKPMYKGDTATGVINKIYYYDVDKSTVELKVLETKKVKMAWHGPEKEYEYPTKVELPVDGKSDKVSMHMTIQSPVLGNDPHANDATLYIDYENKTDGYYEDEDDNKGPLSTAIYNLEQLLKNYNSFVSSKIIRETNNLIADAKRVLRNSKASKKEIDDMIAKINKQIKRISDIYVAKRMYNDAYANYKSSLESGNYTKESMAAIKKELDKAAQLISKEDITEEDVQKVFDMNLSNLYILERYDTSKLQEEIQKAKNILNNGKTYTEDTKKALEEVIKTAENFVETAKNTRLIADNRAELIKNIQEKLNALVESSKPQETDKKPLVEKINQAKAINQGKKTKEAFDELQNAIKIAESKLSTVKTDEEVKKAVRELDDAIAKFNSSADKKDETPLEKLYREFAEEIKNAKSLQDEGDKFPDSHKRLESAIAKAEKDLEDNKESLKNLQKSFDEFKISVTEYKEGNYTSIKDFENILKEKDKTEYIVSVAKVPAVVYQEGSDTKISIMDKSLVKPTRVYVTNKGMKLNLALVGVNEPRKAFLGKISIPKGADFVEAEAISGYTITDEFNDSQNGSDKYMKGKNYPKEVVVDITKDIEVLPVKVYIPAMESIMQGLGTKGANIKFDWTKLEVEKVITTKLEELIANAKEIKQDKKTDEAFEKLQNAIRVAESKLSTIKTVDDLNLAIEELNNAIKNFNNSEDKKELDKKPLEDKIKQAKEIKQDKKTKEAFDKLQAAIKFAEDKLPTIKTLDELTAAVEELSKAIEEFNSSADKKEVDKTSLVNKIAEAKAIKQNKKTDEAFEKLQNAIKTAESKVQTVKTSEDVKTATEELSKAIEEFNSSADKKEVDKTSLVNKIAEAKAIKEDEYQQDGIAKLKEVIAKAESVNSNASATQDEVNAVINELNTAIANLVKIEKEKAYTVNAKLSQVDTTTASMLNVAINEVVKVTEKGSTARYELQFKPVTDNGKTIEVYEIYTMENGQLQKAEIVQNPTGEFNKTFIISRKSLQETNISLDILSDYDKTNTQKYTLSFDWTTKKDFESKPEKPEQKVKLRLVGENISSNPVAGQIKKGEDVTVTVAPAANKEVSLFTVNGVDRKSNLVNNQYKFNIDIDTEIKVEYKDKQTSSGGSSGGGGGGGGGGSSSSSKKKTEIATIPSIKSDKKTETVTIKEEEVAKSTPTVNFTDLKDKHWAIDYIRFVVQKGIMVGVDGNRFDPNGKLSRAMLISMLARISKDKVQDTKKSDAWYSKDMDWAIKAGIISKSQNNKNKAEEALTRSEMATIIGRYLEYKAIKLEESKKEISFKDMKNMSEETMKYVNILAKYEIVVGDKTGKFNPNASLTRAETAVVMTKLIKAISK